jgi:arylsulfatase A-like enzyme
VHLRGYVSPNGACSLSVPPWVWRGSLCVLLGLSGCSPPIRQGAVLITVDTLRADHVGAFSADAHTPHIDLLAREGTVFERAVSPLPLTRPSHFSMLTGFHPREHGVLNNSTQLPDSARTVAEILQERGWRTAAFTATRILGTDSGATQGFDRFESTGSRLQRSGREVVEHALEWLDGLAPEDPFFLWIHLYEPHVPYAPPAGFRADLDAARAEALPQLSWADFQRTARQNQGDVPSAVLEHARQLYRGEVAAADSMVGSFLAGLRDRMQLDEVLVILTADHGECFENGIWFEHSDCLYEGSIRVPLIVRQPEAFPPGRRVAEGVGLFDIAPTVLRSAGVEAPPALSGRPLQELGADGERHFLVQRPYYSEKTAQERRSRGNAIRSVAGMPALHVDDESQWVGVVGPRWKLLVQNGRGELYPVAPRPDESQNLASTEPQLLDSMRSQLAEALRAHPLQPAPGGEVSEELRDALEALGYVD